MPARRVIGGASAVAIALTCVAAVPGVARAACAPSPSLSPYGFTGTVVRLGADPRRAFVQKDDGTQVEVDGGSSAPVSTSAPVGLPSPIGSAPASAELTVFPTASAHPDFVTGAIFILIFALLLAFAYAVRVLRRRRHRWD
jgi:hypothetical protein